MREKKRKTPVGIKEHFTFKKLFRLTIFPIIMMVFSSLYSIVDGIFISNFAGESSFAAVNLIFPMIMIVGSVGFMMGSGGTALVAKYLGEGKKEKASSSFSLIVYSTIAIGLAFSLAGYFLVEPIVKSLSSLSSSPSLEMEKEALLYGRILISAQSLAMLQYLFNSFFMVAERPRVGFRFTLAGGLANMVLDALLIGVANWGVVGAALATISGYLIAGVGPLLYFAFHKDLPIRLGKARFELASLWKTVYNGFSEFASNISMSVVSTVYNAVLLKTYGEDGVSAYGIILYVSFIFMAIFIGYSMGVAPAIGYNYGAKNGEELGNILRKSGLVIGAFSLLMAASSLALAFPLAKCFSSGSLELLDLTVMAMRIYSIVYLAVGVSIFASSFFTALNNGTVSLSISLGRTLIFQVGFLFLFPLFMGDIGIWWALSLGEVLCGIIAFLAIFFFRKKYGYSFKIPAKAE